MCVSTCIARANYFGDPEDKESLIYKVMKANKISVLKSVKSNGEGKLAFAQLKDLTSMEVARRSVIQAKHLFLPIPLPQNPESITYSLKEDKKMEDRNNGNGISRRNFMKCSAVLGGALLTTQLEWATDLMKRAEAGVLTPEEEYELIRAENTLYTVCLQCNTGCGIKVKLFRKNGSAIALKIDGNPYDPWNAVPHLPYNKLYLLRSTR